jgi:hypothetical protein
VTPPQSQVLQHDSPQLVSQEEPFEIEIVVPESPEAQDTLVEEPKQQPVEDDEDEVYSLLSDLEREKLYHDAEEMEGRFGSALKKDDKATLP